MKCEKCDKDAVTFHGVMTVTHGYCEKHRCCYRCGLHITDCKCKEGHLERPEYIEYRKAQHGYQDQTKDWENGKISSW